MLKNKKVMQIFRIIISFIAIVFSPYICAKTVHTLLELECSKNPMAAPWFIVKGKSGFQYTLTTKGLRDARKDGIAKVNKVGFFLAKTSYGLNVYVEARCIPQDEETNVSSTDSSLICNKGEGIKISMLEPNSGNSNEYHYVGTLTITIDEKDVKEEKKQKVTINNMLQPDVELTEPKVKGHHSFINGF